MNNTLSSLLEKLSIIKLKKQIETEINELFYVYGSPYYVVCFKCNMIYPCIFIHHDPFSDDETNKVLGLLVFVESSSELDEKIELLFKTTKVIRSYGKRTAFYIPYKYTLSVMNRLCTRDKLRNPEIYPLKIEEAEIFLEEY
jgi:hypothetical protein